MKNLKSLTIIIVAALAIVASVFCANDANAYFGSPVSHGHYGRSVGHRGGHGYHHGGRGHGFSHRGGHGYHRGGRGHGFSRGGRGHGFRGGRRGGHGCRRCHR